MWRILWNFVRTAFSIRSTACVTSFADRDRRNRKSRARVVRPMWNSRETRAMPHARNTLRKHMRLRVLRTSTADFPAVEDAANAQSLDLEKQYLHRQKSAWRRLASRRTIFSRTRKD